MRRPQRLIAAAVLVALSGALAGCGGGGLGNFDPSDMLDFLDLTDTHSENDLESAILREIERFLLELGTGFAFVERQKRITLDGDDYYLDLLFFHRRMQRLVATREPFASTVNAPHGTPARFARMSAGTPSRFDATKTTRAARLPSAQASRIA